MRWAALSYPSLWTKFSALSMLVKFDSLTRLKFRITGGGSLKLVHAFFILLVLVRLRPALGFILGVGVGDANNISCLEGERQALLEFKKGLVDDYGRLSSWRSEDENKNCCN